LWIKYLKKELILRRESLKTEKGLKSTVKLWIKYLKKELILRRESLKTDKVGENIWTQILSKSTLPKYGPEFLAEQN